MSQEKFNKVLLKWYYDNGVNYSISRPNIYISSIAKKNIKIKTEELNNKKNTLADCNSLEKLREAIDSFEECALKMTSKNLVFADGNPESKIMLLGEAPGEEEDKTGIPFVGAAGKLLDKMLLAINQSRKNTYISNIIFWRPPGNRRPTEQEVQLCLPFVYKHIEIIRPKILILAGSTAAKAILNLDLGITKIRGIWYDLNFQNLKQKTKTMAIYHPAFLIRQPARKREAWEDLKRIKSEIDKIT